MSQLSLHTQTSLSIQPASPIPKRPRTNITFDSSTTTTTTHHAATHHAATTAAPPVTYTNPNPRHIAFITPITTTKVDIISTISTISTASSLTIDPSIHFTPTLHNRDTKLTYITTIHPDHTDPITTILRHHYPNSEPRLLMSIPPTVTTPQTLDFTPPAHTAIPTNCRITQCPFYNNGFEEAPMILNPYLTNFTNTTSVSTLTS